MDEFTQHLDKEFLDAIERTIAEVCKEMRKPLRGHGAEANWHLLAKAAWDEAIDYAAGRILGATTDNPLRWGSSASEPNMHNLDRKLNRF